MTPLYHTYCEGEALPCKPLLAQQWPRQIMHGSLRKWKLRPKADWRLSKANQEQWQTAGSKIDYDIVLTITPIPVNIWYWWVIASLKRSMVKRRERWDDGWRYFLSYMCILWNISRGLRQVRSMTMASRYYRGASHIIVIIIKRENARIL